MVIKLVLYGLIIYFILKLFRSFNVSTQKRTHRTPQNSQQNKSYNEQDVIDVDFKEIKDDK